MRFRLASMLIASALLVVVPQRAAAPQQATPPALPVTPEWRTALDAAPTAAYATDAARIFLALAAADTPAQVVAVSLESGAVAWRRDLADVVALAADGDLVFATTKTALHALAAADGGTAWQLPLDAAGMPLLTAANGWLVIGSDRQVTVLRAHDGTRVWQQAAPARLAIAPILAGDSLYLGTADNRVVRMALTSGATVWTGEVPAAPSSVLPLDDRVFVGTRGRSFCALDPRTGKRKWRVRTGSDIVGVTAVDARCAYFLSLDNLIRGVNRSSGTLESRHILSRRALFGPFRAGNLLVVSGMSPTLEAFSLPALRPAGTFDVGGREEGGVKLVAPLHLVPGGPEVGQLIVGVTGEGDIVALRLGAPKAQTSKEDIVRVRKSGVRTSRPRH